MVSGDPKESNEDADFTDTAGETTEQKSLELKNIRAEGNLFVLPVGGKMEYLTFSDGEMIDAQLSVANRVQEQIFLIADIPSTIFGITSGDNVPRVSGEALKRTFIPTYLKTRELQNLVIESVIGAFASIGVEEEIVWPNPLEELDADTSSAEVESQDAGEDDPEEEENDSILNNIILMNPKRWMLFWRRQA